MFPQAYNDSREAVEVRRLVAAKEFSSMITESKNVSEAYRRLDRMLEAQHGGDAKKQHELNRQIDAWLADQKKEDEPEAR